MLAQNNGKSWAQVSVLWWRGAGWKQVVIAIPCASCLASMQKKSLHLPLLWICSYYFTLKWNLLTWLKQYLIHSQILFLQFLPFIYSVKNILWFFFSNDCCSLVRSSLTLSIWQLVQKFVIKVTDLIKILAYLWKQHFNCAESFSKTITPLFYKSDTRDPS